MKAVYAIKGCFVVLKDFDQSQELKDDLLDDTAWPVVMQWFNEDH